MQKGSTHEQKTIDKPQLRPELEVLRGMDNITLIYDPKTTGYHRISKSGAFVLSLMDGENTINDIIAIIHKKNQDENTNAAIKRLEQFLEQLDDAGLLTCSSPVNDKQSFSYNKITKFLMPRLVITRSLPKILEPLANRFKNIPNKPIFIISLIISFVGFAGGAFVLAQTSKSFYEIMRDSLPSFLTATFIQLILVFFHECAHALVAQIRNVPVRSLGVALLFGFMPVAYVDRTDAYRLKDREGRVALALAGVVSDGFFCGLAVLTFLVASDQVKHVMVILIGIQILGLIINLNPLLPSDGYSAIEAASGEISFRKHSFLFVTGCLFGIKLPNYLVGLSLRRKVAYFIYAALSLLYIGAMAISTLFIVWQFTLNRLEVL